MNRDSQQPEAGYIPPEPGAVPGPPPDPDKRNVEVYELADTDGVAAPTPAPPSKPAPPATPATPATPKAPAPSNGSNSADINVAQPPRRSSGTTGLLLLIALALAAIPMSVQLSRFDVTDPGEAASVSRAVHSWQRHHGGNLDLPFRFEQLIPYCNGQRRLEREPAAYWLHSLTMHLMADPIGDIDHLVLCLRITSVCFALLTVAAVFWIGVSIGGARAAFLAAVTCAAMPLFIHHARLASPVIYHLSFASLAIAAATWAIRPLKPAASTERQLIGWIICGLSLGAAGLAAGPIAAVTVVCPILLIMLLCQDRVGHLMGLLAAMFMGVLLVLPWALYAHEHDSNVWRLWLVEITRGVSNNEITTATGQRLLMFVVAIAPWTLWALVGLVQPMSTSSKGRRVRLLLSGVWFFVVALVLLAMPQNNSWNWIAPLVIPAAVLVGQLFNHYADLAAAGRFARNWRWMRWPHLLIMTGASIVLPLALYAEGAPTLDIDALRDLASDTSAMLLPAGWIIGLLAVTALSVRWSQRNYPDRAATAWAVWAMVLSCAAAAALTGRPLTINPMRENAERLASLTSGEPVYWNAPNAPDPRLTVYARAGLQPVQSIQLRQAIDDGQPFYVLSVGAPVGLAPHLNLVANLPSADVQLWHFEVAHE